MRGQRLITAINGSIWAITEGGMHNVTNFIEKAINTKEYDYRAIEALQAKKGVRDSNYKSLVVRDGVGIIALEGIIYPRSDIMVDWCGAPSAEMLIQDITAALTDPTINAILIDTDSPGGAITDISAASDFIFQSKEIKPIVGYGRGLMASAAYWICSGCTEIVIDKTSEVGSIGAISTIITRNDTGKNQYTFLSSVSPKKRPKPDDEAGAQQIQAKVDNYGQIFVSAVARNRDVSEETVLNEFGQGDTFIGVDAVKAGLVDRIGSLEDLIKQYGNPQTTQTQVFFMSQQQPSAAATPEITTVAALQESYPKLTAQIATDAIGAERARVQRLLKVSAKAGLPHDDETLLAAIADGTSSGDFSEALIEQGKVAMGATKAAAPASNPMLDAIHADASPNVRTVAAQEDEPESKDDQDFAAFQKTLEAKAK